MKSEKLRVKVTFFSNFTKNTCCDHPMSGSGPENRGDWIGGSHPRMSHPNLRVRINFYSQTHVVELYLQSYLVIVINLTDTASDR